MKRQLGILLFIVLLFLTACGQKGIPDAKNWPIEDFSSINQDGQDFGLKDLKGKIWVADFIFTNCTTVCPPMTFNMAKLQNMVKEEGIENVEFISFSIDPVVDTPEVLKTYAEQYNIDPSNWNFLTGYSQDFIEKFGPDNFKTIIKKPENEDQVIHQTYFYLVDQEGKIMKYYSGSSEVPYAEIIDDMKALAS